MTYALIFNGLYGTTLMASLITAILINRDFRMTIMKRPFMRIFKSIREEELIQVKICYILYSTGLSNTEIRTGLMALLPAG